MKKLTQKQLERLLIKVAKELSAGSVSFETKIELYNAAMVLEYLNEK